MYFIHYIYIYINTLRVGFFLYRKKYKYKISRIYECINSISFIAQRMRVSPTVLPKLELKIDEISTYYTRKYNTCVFIYYNLDEHKYSRLETQKVKHLMTYNIARV